MVYFSQPGDAPTTGVKKQAAGGDLLQQNIKAHNKEMRRTLKKDDVHYVREDSKWK